MRCLIFFIIISLSLTWQTTAFSHDNDSVPAKKTYRRIISLYSAHTENLAALGACDQLIGITLSDDYPPEITAKPRFSYRQDPEKFIAARPDLILIRPMIEHSYPQLIAKLRQAGIKVISLQPTSVAEIFTYWQDLGELCGRKQAAEKMIATFKKDISLIADSLHDVAPHERPMVYFESIHKKMKTFARQSIAIFVLEQAGGINVAADAVQVRKTNIADYGKERILAKANEIDFFIAQQGRMNPVSLEMIKNEPGFQAIRAVRQGRIFLIDERLVSRPTRRIVEGVRMLNRIFFKDDLADNQGKRI
jgi:iron complex transport system substrate-binding protein